MPEELIDLKAENILGESSGIKLNLGHSRMRAIYWRCLAEGDWVQTRPLPADPFSISYYFSKGFRAQRPEVKSSNGLNLCSCGFEAKSHFGLEVHQRKCKSLGEGQFSKKTEIKQK